MVGGQTGLQKDTSGPWALIKAMQLSEVVWSERYCVHSNISPVFGLSGVLKAAFSTLKLRRSFPLNPKTDIDEVIPTAAGQAHPRPPLLPN